MSDDSDLCVAAGDPLVADDEDMCVAAYFSEMDGPGGSSSSRGRRGRYPSEESFLSWLLVDGSLPPPARLRPDPVADWHSLVPATPGSVLALGVVRCTWHLRPSSPEALESHDALRPAGRPLWSVEVGFLEYEVTDVYRFGVPILCEGNEALMVMNTLQIACASFRLGEGGGTVSDAVQTHALNSTLRLPVAVATSLLLGDASVVKSIRLTRQLRYEGVIPTHPKKFVIRHYWQQWCHGALDTPASLDRPVLHSAQVSSAELRHPQKRGLFDTEKLKRPTKKSRYDPVKLIQAIDFQHYLRDEGKFTQAMAAGRRYDADTSDEEEAPAPKKVDPSKSTRQRARHRVDVVSMLLERREFQEWYERDLVRSVQVYSDASPVVGVELQGQLIDVVLVDGTIHRRVFPGSELPYGNTGVVSKCVALLWGFVLTIGAEPDIIRYALSKVSCVTTDNGTEIDLIQTPDLVEAFFSGLEANL